LAFGFDNETCISDVKALLVNLCAKPARKQWQPQNCATAQSLDFTTKSVNHD